MSEFTNIQNPAFPAFDANGYLFRGSEGLTKQEHAAIALRVPMSGDPELDAMIREARRLDAAQAAMQGFLSDWGEHAFNSALCANLAKSHASELLALWATKEGGSA